MNRPELPDHRQVARAFGRAARGYAASALLQREVRARLLERLDDLDCGPVRRALDLGCGPGAALRPLARRYRGAQLLALDLALPMLREVRRDYGLLRRAPPLLCADAAHLPLADGCLDLVFSSLCLQWVPDLPAAFAEYRRVLRPGGLLVFATLGPDTLHELREAFAAVDDAVHVGHFVPIQQVGDALVGAGFRDPVLDQDPFTLTYPDAAGVLRDLKAIGATNASVARRRGLTGKSRMQAMYRAYESFRRDGVLPSTWQVVYAHAFAPPPGQPQRLADGELARIPVSSIPIRRRSGA